MAVITNFGVPAAGASATLMPKLQYRFRISFVGIGGDTEKTPLVTTNVISATRPQLDHEDVTIDTYNSKIRLAGKHTWSDVTVVLRDDVDGNVITALDKQLSKQVNHNDQTSAKSGSDYKFKMLIETLDGSDDDGNGNAKLDEWTLVGCFIPSIQYGDLNYSSSDMVQVTVTVRFDNASHTILNGGDDILASVPTGAGNSSATTDGSTPN